jgi:hypothetical protein
MCFRTTIDKYEKNTVLTVRRVTRADSGKYKLILTNGSGTCESVADVVVLGKNFYLLMGENNFVRIFDYLTLQLYSVYNIGLNKNNNEVFVTVLHIFYYVKNL